MKKISLLVVIAISSCIDNSKSEKKYSGPPKFVLTEMNGRELEENAYFTIKYDNTFILEIADGTTFNYIPTQHVGSDPLCGILATDDFNRNTAICMKKLSERDFELMLENDVMISNFKGYKL